MFKLAKTLLAAVLLTSAVSGTSVAATIPFQIDTANSSVTVSNCVDLLCVTTAQLAPAMLGNPIINVTPNGPATVFDFIRFNPVVDLGGPDSFIITATLAFLSPVFGPATSTGTGTGFTTVTPFAFPVVTSFTSGTLTWAPIAPQNVAGVGLVTLSFINPPTSLFGTGSAPNPLSVITQASISVVPLPAGVLLLGTALLGLFGLSRRRKSALA